MGERVFFRRLGCGMVVDNKTLERFCDNLPIGHPLIKIIKPKRRDNYNPRESRDEGYDSGRD